MMQTYLRSARCPQTSHLAQQHLQMPILSSAGVQRIQAASHNVLYTTGRMSDPCIVEKSAYYAKEGGEQDS
jgi:hypothetical protein